MAADSIPTLPGGYPETPSPYGGLRPPFGPSGPVGPDGAAVAAAGSGAPTGQPAQNAASKADSSLSNAAAKPCAKCKQTNFSIAFRVKDSKGNLCKGMYYSVYYASQGGQTGTTDDNGLTERYYGNENEKIMLYLGHRDNLDKDHPEEATSDEDKYDEAPLAHDTFAPVEEKKIADAKTQRLWKPWKVSTAGQDFTAQREALRRNEYDNDGAKDGNVTIGIGNLVHSGPFVMDQGKVDQTVDYLRGQGQPVTPDNLVGAVGPATGLRGADLTQAQKEMGYVNGVTSQEALDTFKNKTYPEHAKRIEQAVFVPLYQNEYDALADVSYNRGPAIIDLESKKRNPGGSYALWLNRGRYHYVGKNRINTLARSAVPDRRDAETNEFMDGNYAPRKMSDLAYQPGNHTPWKPVEFDK